MRKILLFFLLGICFSTFSYGSVKNDIINQVKKKIELRTPVFQCDVPIKNQRNKFGQLFDDYSIFVKLGMLTFTENSDGTRNYDLTEKGKKYLYKNTSMLSAGFIGAQHIYIDSDYKAESTEGIKNYAVKFRYRIKVMPWVKEAFEITKDSSNERYQFNHRLFEKLLKKDGNVFEDSFNYIPN